MTEETKTVATKGNTTLSKSQKKRLKRNASKAKRLTEGSSGPPSSGSSKKKQQEQQRQDPLNPHAKLRQDLLSLGYSVEEIDPGMEEMWNLGMQYDELEVVVSYLEKKREQWEKEVNLHSESVEEEDKPLITEEPEVVEEEETSSYSPNVVDDEEEQQQPQGEGASDDIPQESEPEQTMDLSSRLDVVANFENLQDSLFALSEWVNKAANPSQLLDFCGISINEVSAKSRSPLATILKRCIVYEGDSYTTQILPYLRAILSGLIMTQIESPSVFDDLLNVIYYSRSTVSVLGCLPPCVKDDISTTISRVIAALVCKNLKKNIVGDEDSPAVKSSLQSQIVEINNEINHLISQVENQPPSRGGVIELMTERDCRKCLAEKSIDLAKLVSDAISYDDKDLSQQHDMVTKLFQSNDGKMALFSSILGEHYSSVQTGVQSLREIESQIKSLQASLTLKHAEIASESLRVHSEISRIIRRKEELRLELEQLERNEVLLQNREVELNAVLTSAEGGAEISFLQSKRDEFVGMLRVDDAVRNLIDKLSDFEAAFFAKAENTEKKLGSFYKEEISSEELENKMDLLLKQMKCYFHAEEAITKFLSNRVVAMKIDYEDLQSETTEFTALGLTTNVTKMTQSLEEFSRNISDDESVLSALRLEADKMQADLVERLDQYINAPGNRILTTMQRSAVSQIMESLSRIGSDFSQLSSLMKPNDTCNGSRNYTLADLTNDAERNVPAKPDPVIASLPPTMSHRGQRRVTNEQQPPIIESSFNLRPKLNWAVRNGAPTQKKEVKSLLDIQKEELSAKQLSS